MEESEQYWSVKAHFEASLEVIVAGDLMDKIFASVGDDVSMIGQDLGLYPENVYEVSLCLDPLDEIAARGQAVKIYTKLAAECNIVFLLDTLELEFVDTSDLPEPDYDVFKGRQLAHSEIPQHFIVMIDGVLARLCSGGAFRSEPWRDDGSRMLDKYQLSVDRGATQDTLKIKSISDFSRAFLPLQTLSEDSLWQTLAELLHPK